MRESSGGYGNDRERGVYSNMTKGGKGRVYKEKDGKAKDPPERERDEVERRSSPGEERQASHLRRRKFR